MSRTASEIHAVDPVRPEGPAELRMSEDASGWASPWRWLGCAVAALLLVTALTFTVRDNLPEVVFVLAIPAFLLALRHPLAGTAIAVATTQTYGWLVVGPDVSLFQVLVLCSAAGAAWAERGRLVELARAARHSPILLWALALVAWVVLAAAVKAGSSDGGTYLRSFAGSGVLVALAVLVVRTGRARALLIAGLVFGAVATAVAGLAQFWTTDALVSSYVFPSLEPYRTSYQAMASPWGLSAVGSNFSKDVLVGVLLLLPFLGMTRVPRIPRAVPVAVVCGLSLALAISGSRSAWLGTIAACGYLVLVAPTRSVRVGAGALAILMAICVIHPTLNADLQKVIGRYGAGSVTQDGALGPGGIPTQGVAGVRDAYSTEASNNLRRKLLKASAKMIEDHPVFGVGPGAFKYNVAEYAPRDDPKQIIDDRAELPSHNVAVEIWADSGTPAFLAFAALCLAMVVALERRRRRTTGLRRTEATALTAALVGLLITSMFHNYQFDNVFWILAGLAAATQVRLPSERDEDLAEVA